MLLRRRPLGASSWLLALGAFTAAFSALFLALLIVRPFANAQIVEIDNLATIAGPAMVLPFAFGWLRIRRPARRTLRAWNANLPATFLALGATTDTIGQAIWTYYAQVLHQPVPFPSLDDVSYLCTYPLLLTGILLIPNHGASAVSRSRASVEGLIVMAAAFTFSWYFVLGPTVLQGGESILGKVVGTAYPMGDLLLIGALVVLAFRSSDRSASRVTMLLFSGLGAMVVADYVFDIGTLHNTYQTGQLVDVLWPLADMLVALAATALRVTPFSRTATKSATDTPLAVKQSLVLAWLPYCLVGGVGVLDTVLLVIHGDNRLTSGVVVGSVCLVFLIMAQQVLATLENQRLSRRVQENNRELRLANDRLQALATSDPLTDLPNHRGIAGILASEVERACRYHRQLVVLFVDLDHFKAVNDTLGHSAGDVLLKEFAQSAKESLRATDVLGRWGGEEFVAVLPENDREQGLAVAERLRAQIAAARFSNVEGVRVTCSIGVASFPEAGTTVNELVSQADGAMYAAKRLGR